MSASGRSSSTGNGWKFFVFTLLVIIASYISSSSSAVNDPFRCNAPTSTGHWLDSPASGRSKTPYQRWQPDGCMLRNYNAKSIESCLAAGDGQDAIFNGDSTVREVFWATARKLNATKARIESAKAEKHADIHFQQGKTTLTFKWDPFLNSTTLPEYLRASREALEHPNRDEVSKSSRSKAIVVIGAGLWFEHMGPHAVDEFKNAMDKVALPKQPPFHETPDYPGENRVFILPVQTPFYEHLDEAHKALIKPEHINKMNAYMHDLPTVYGVDTLTSFLEMGGDQSDAYQPNGLHVMNTIADRQAEVILNIRCNNYNRAYPYDGTCCYDYPLHHGPSIFIVLGFCLFALVAGAEASDWLGAGPSPIVNFAKRHMSFLRPTVILWAALCYCYLADRTHTFEKVTKQYNNQDFFLFCFGIAVAGLLTVKKSASPKTNPEKNQQQDQPLLSRDQTDEWKGWMQALILAYHYTGASKVLWIYKIVRLLVASYLFMTGYGHAAYFYQKADFSLKRLVAVNLRINILSILLPWFMSTDYIFYYFAPLVTYWYFIIYLTMRIKSDWNQKLPLFLAKVGAAAACTTVLHTQAHLLEPLFALVNGVLGSRWDAREWMFRCALDQYIVYVGMVVSVLYIRSTKPPSPPPPPQNSFASTAHVQRGSSPRMRTAQALGIAAAFLAVYGYGSSLTTSKTSSNALHTYISPFAVLAFVLLRNASRGLRNYYSAAFAWLGRISLETFILQYHLWLAADTKGLLSTGLFGHGAMSAAGSWTGSGMGVGRWLDCLVLGVVFVWVSLKVAEASGGVCGWLIKKLF